jgi:RNA-binding protein
VVLLGQHGLTPGIVTAIDEALSAHELIKVRLRGVEREDRNRIQGEIAAQVQADVVNAIGHVLTLYRKNPETTAPARARGR